jgi:hypothetical protein
LDPGTRALAVDPAMAPPAVKKKDKTPPAPASAEAEKGKLVSLFAPSDARVPGLPTSPGTASSPACLSGTLLRDAEAKKKRTQANRRSQDAIIERSLETHFQHLSAQQRTSVKVNGMTLRERVESDRGKLPTGRRLGAKYWDLLSAEFLAATDPVLLIQPTNAAEVVSDGLITVMEILHHASQSRRQSAPMATYLAAATSVNETELIGICAAVVTPTGIRRSAMESLVMDVGALVQRLDLGKKYPAVIQAFRPHLDLALAAQFGKLKTLGLAIEGFLKRFPAAYLLLADADVAAVLAARGSWDSVEQEVHRLVHGSNLGRTLFGFAADLVMAASFSRKLDCVLDDFWAMEAVTSQDFAALLQRSVSILTDLGGTRLGRREISVPFLPDLAIKVVVSTAADEAELRLKAAVKAAALGQVGGLRPLPWERRLVGQVSGGTCKVHWECLAEMVAAREIAGQLASCCPEASLRDLAKLCERRATELCALDRSFSLELAFLTSGDAGVALDTAFREDAFKLLPSAHRTVGFKAALAGLAALRSDDAWRLVSGDARDAIVLMEDWGSICVQKWCSTDTNSSFLLLRHVWRQGKYGV